jgi:hypothetical protein
MDPLERRCGSCARFVRVIETIDVAGEVTRKGECLLGVWPSPLFETSTCSQWVRRGEFKPRPEGSTRTPRVRPVRGAAKGPARESTPFMLPEDLLAMNEQEFRNVLVEVIREELGVGEVELAGKWDGGEMILKPAKEGLQEKRIPLGSLFHKVVMIRDRLRVLEQKINGHAGLADDEKVQLQQYVTACYGSLTTFNVLFANREDQFIGQKGDE